MRTFFRFIFLALILLVVALFSALTAMRFAIHTREVAVPDLVGKAPAEARRIAELNGFQFEVERQYYSPKIPAGLVLSQLPPAGAKIRRGWQIRAAESLGPQRVEIPNVIGQSERAAEINILRRGLDVGAVAQVQLAGVPVDQVIAQSPSPSATSISAPKINLLSAQLPQPQAFVMPSFIGQTVGAATEALKDAGLRVENVSSTVPLPNAPAPGTMPQSSAVATQPSSDSIIVSQNPHPGDKVVADSAVSFEVR
jgi:beta-lactam-binding protein with PASTA domain